MIQQIVHVRLVFWRLRDDHKIVQVDIRKRQWSLGRLRIIGVYGVGCGGMYDGMLLVLNKGVFIGVVAEGCLHVG